MKKIFLSIGIGCGITWALYLFASQPSDGLRLIVFVLLPFRLFASLVTKDRAFGEVVYFGSQILLASSIAFVAPCLIGCARRSQNGVAFRFIQS
jgi:hypothetical protein